MHLNSVIHFSVRTIVCPEIEIECQPPILGFQLFNGGSCLSVERGAPSRRACRVEVTYAFHLSPNATILSWLASKRRQRQWLEGVQEAVAAVVRGRLDEGMPTAMVDGVLVARRNVRSLMVSGGLVHGYRRNKGT